MWLIMFSFISQYESRNRHRSVWGSLCNGPRVLPARRNQIWSEHRRTAHRWHMGISIKWNINSSNIWSHMVFFSNLTLKTEQYWCCSWTNVHFTYYLFISIFIIITRWVWFAIYFIFFVGIGVQSSTGKRHSCWF